MGVVLWSACSSAPVSIQDIVDQRFGTERPRRPVHTYSIVARDPKTGDLGVAVQSHWFSVGSSVTWAQAGVGAVATQSFVEPAYGLRGLELMKRGLSAQQALEALVRVDEGQAVRQVAFVDARGQVAVHTGAACIESAGHATGEGFSVQANLMVNGDVVPAMRQAYAQSSGDFAERLIESLEAAQRAGGDVRGQQSAAILIVKSQSSGQPWKDKRIDLRVEDHPKPVAELRRLLMLHRAYAFMNAGDVAVEKGDMAGALRAYASARRIAPQNVEMTYWTAITMATNGRLSAALPLFKQVFAADRNWVDLTKRLQKPGILPAGAEGQTLIKKILSVAP